MGIKKEERRNPEDVTKSITKKLEAEMTQDKKKTTQPDAKDLNSRFCRDRLAFGHRCWNFNEE